MDLWAMSHLRQAHGVQGAIDGNVTFAAALFSDETSVGVAMVNSSLDHVYTYYHWTKVLRDTMRITRCSVSKAQIPKKKR